MFKKNNITKRSTYNINIHKATRITDGIFQTNIKFFVTVHPKKSSKLEFVYHLWIPFID